MKKLRNIKNLLLLIFSIVLTIGSFNSVKASGTDINNLQVKISDAIAKPGEEITVPILLSNVPSQGINNCNFNLQFDTNLLELVDVVPGALVVNPGEDFSFSKYDPVNITGTIQPNQIQFLFNDESYDFSRAITQDGVFANIKFKVKNLSSAEIPPAGLITVIFNAPYGGATATTVDKRCYVFGVNDIDNGIINVYPPIGDGYVTISSGVTSIDFQNLQADEAAIGFGDITGDITLPSTGAHGSTITWSSSNVAIISNSGQVIRPEAGQPDAYVTLKATFVNGTAIDTKVIEVVVKAKEQTINIIYGDVNGDGAITSTDVQLIQRYLMHNTPFVNVNGEVAGDVNGDGAITSTDVQLIQRFLMNKIPSLPR